MRVPSANQTITYFASLGYLVEHCSEKNGARVWKISGPSCPLDGRTFATRLALWAEWLDYSAERIYEDAMAQGLMDLWKKSDQAGRALLSRELADWQEGRVSARLKKLIRKAPAVSPDTLPPDWKRRIAQILADDPLGKPLWLVIREMSTEPSALCS